MKNNFLRSYLKLALGGAGLSLIVTLFTALDGIFSLGYLKVIAEFLIFVAVVVLLAKRNKFREIPKAYNGLFVTMLIPVLINLWCFYAPLNNRIGVGALFIALFDLIFGTLWKQVFFVGIGTMLFKQNSSYKLLPNEMFAIVSAFLISCFFDGFTLDLVQALSIAFLSLAFYLRTSSLDLPISFALLISLSTRFFSIFSNASIVMSPSYFVVIYLANALLISLIAYGVLRNNNLLSTVEYN